MAKPQSSTTWKNYELEANKPWSGSDVLFFFFSQDQELAVDLKMPKVWSPSNGQRVGTCSQNYQWFSLKTFNMVFSFCHFCQLFSSKFSDPLSVKILFCCFFFTLHSHHSQASAQTVDPEVVAKLDEVLSMLRRGNRLTYSFIVRILYVQKYVQYVQNICVSTMYSYVIYIIYLYIYTYICIL